MNSIEEINELKDVLEEALSSAKVSRNRCQQLIELHPQVDNSKYLAIDNENIKTLKECIDLLDDLMPYPEP